MDAQAIVSYIIAAVALIFLGYERYIATRRSTGDYIESLATASHEAVEMSRTIVLTLQVEIADLRTKITKLEARLSEYEKCDKIDCPVRQRRSL